LNHIAVEEAQLKKLKLGAIADDKPVKLTFSPTARSSRAKPDKAR
jgi:hypothetical protein